MPTATADKKGLMSTSAFDIINSMIGLGTTNVQQIVKITMSGKINFLCGCISNFTRPILFSFFRTSSTGLPKIKSFYHGELLQFYCVTEGDTFYVYVKGINEWGEFSIVPFCGNLDSIEIVAEIPDNVEALEFIE